MLQRLTIGFKTQRADNITEVINTASFPKAVFFLWPENKSFSNKKGTESNEKHTHSQIQKMCLASSKDLSEIRKVKIV